MTAVFGFGSGGGVYQLDAFYDAADDLGVLLYHVRMTCSTLIHLSQPRDLTVLLAVCQQDIQCAHRLKSVTQLQQHCKR